MSSRRRWANRFANRARILLVARDWTPRVLIRAQLEAEGHEVTGCLTLDDALLELKLSPGGFDAVILDTVGQELKTGALRRLASAGPPILVLTSVFDRNEVEALGLPFARVLARPVFVGDVTREVGEMLARRTGAASP